MRWINPTLLVPQLQQLLGAFDRGASTGAFALRAPHPGQDTASDSPITHPERGNPNSADNRSMRAQSPNRVRGPVQILPPVEQQRTDVECWIDAHSLGTDRQPRLPLCSQDVVVMEVAVREDPTLGRGIQFVV